MHLYLVSWEPLPRSLCVKEEDEIVRPVDIEVGVRYRYQMMYKLCIKSEVVVRLLHYSSHLV